MEHLNNVTRLEVINHLGRSFVQYFPSGSLSYLKQDTGKTLKLIIDEPPVSGWKFRGRPFTLRSLTGLLELEGLDLFNGSSTYLDYQIASLVELGYDFTSE